MFGSSCRVLFQIRDRFSAAGIFEFESSRTIVVVRDRSNRCRDLGEVQQQVGAVKRCVEGRRWMEGRKCVGCALQAGCLQRPGQNSKLARAQRSATVGISHTEAARIGSARVEDVSRWVTT